MAGKEFNNLTGNVVDALQQALLARRSAFDTFYTEEEQFQKHLQGTLDTIKFALAQAPRAGFSPVSTESVSFAGIDAAVLQSETTKSVTIAETTKSVSIAETVPDDGKASSIVDIQVLQGVDFAQDLKTEPSKAADLTQLEIATTRSGVHHAGAQHTLRDIKEHARMDGNLALDPEECMPKDRSGLGATQRFFANLEENSLFEAFCTLMILANTIALTISTERSVQYYWQDEPEVFSILETIFLCWYIIELAIRIAAFRDKFFLGSDKEWHIFDVIIVVLTIPDRAVALSGAKSQVNISFMRILRMSRLLKLGRVGSIVKKSMRIRLLLQMCVEGLVQALPLLLFVAALLWGFSLCILSMVGNFLQDEWEVVDEDIKSKLLERWGSMKDVMLSCFMAATGGAPWDDLTFSLREVGTFVFVVFMIFISFYGLVATNIVTCVFIHTMLICAENADKFKVAVQLLRTNRMAGVLGRLLGGDVLTYHEFYQHLVNEDDECIPHFLRNVMGTSTIDADFLFFTLSANGTEPVYIVDFVLGLIELKSPVTKMDVMKLKNNIDVALEEHAQEHQNATSRLARAATGQIGLNEAAEGQTHIRITPATEGTLLKQIHIITCRLPTAEKQTAFTRTIERMVEIVKNAKGGCGFLLTTNKGFACLKNLRIDFQVVDRDSRFPQGYMTYLLRNKLNSNIFSQEFMDAMIEFTSHGEADRWPENHEAGGLPKDGYTIMSMGGQIMKGASRIVGLPMPPERWDGVGTRHLAALAACWALRLHPSLLIVRSDSGKVHWLYSQHNEIQAVELVDRVDIEDDGSTLPMVTRLSTMSKQTARYAQSGLQCARGLSGPTKKLVAAKEARAKMQTATDQLRELACETNGGGEITDDAVTQTAI